MTRIPEITSKAELPENMQHVYDAIADTRGGVRGPFALLLNSPDLTGRVTHLGTYLRYESALPKADREIAIITAAREADCDYEWSAHSRLAREAGVREEAIEIIARRGPLAQLTKEEATIVAYGRELLRNHKVSEATFEAAKGRYGIQGVTDLTTLLGYYTMIACVLNGFEKEPPEGAARLP